MREQMTRWPWRSASSGLMNAQFAIQDDEVYILEVNPRASRTVPFVSKAIGVPLAKVGARCMVGRSLAEQGCSVEVRPRHYFVKEAVFPFVKFPGVDTVLGPEMKSTGEVMGVGESLRRGLRARRPRLRGRQQGQGRAPAHRGPSSLCCMPTAMNDRNMAIT
jgi:carbamoyl-phosphate synthase large subunit